MVLIILPLNMERQREAEGKRKSVESHGGRENKKN